MGFVIYKKAYDSKNKKYINNIKLYYDGEHDKNFIGFTSLCNALIITKHEAEETFKKHMFDKKRYGICEVIK